MVVMVVVAGAGGLRGVLHRDDRDGSAGGQDEIDAAAAFLQVVAPVQGRGAVLLARFIKEERSGSEYERRIASYRCANEP